MGRVVRGRGRSLPAPKRQIANSGLPGGLLVPAIATLTFGASTGPIKAAFSIGLSLTEAAATLVRTRGHLVVEMLTSGGVTNQVTGAVGMIVASQDAFSVGVTALPGPLSDIENDWFVYEPFALATESANPPVDSRVSHVMRQFDSRGMRKLKNGETLVMVIEGVQSDATTGTVIRAAAQYRVQVKL